MTIISTITGNNNNSHLHETFHLNGSQRLEDSADRCAQVTSRPQTLYKPPSAESVGRCCRSSIQPLPWSFPMHRDGAESLTGLLANNGGLSPRGNFSGTKRHFFCAAPRKDALASPSGSVSLRDAGTLLSAPLLCCTIGHKFKIRRHSGLFPGNLQIIN